MKIGLIVLAVAVLLGGGYFFATQNGAATALGESAPRPDAARVNFDWALSEGELMLGTADMNVPLGINVLLEIDNDRADTLVVKGYDTQFELPQDSVVTVEFYTHKKGRYQVALASSGQTLGSLTVVDSQ